VQGCKYVIHAASPIAIEKVADEEKELFKPAVEGTLNVLKACAQSKGAVHRVVVTSSEGAVMAGHENYATHTFDEKDWSVEAKISGYPKSKLLAERAAWDFWKQLKDEEKFELTILNPSYVQGPLLTRKGCTSLALVKRLMLNDMPGIPEIGINMVDVRDVALAHVRAMRVPAAANQRYLISAEWKWFRDVCALLKSEFASKGYTLPSFYAPYALIWIVSFWDKQAAFLLKDVGRKVLLSATKAEKDLGMRWLPINQTLVDMAYTAIELGLFRNMLPLPDPNKQLMNRADDVAMKGVRWMDDSKTANCIACQTAFSLITRRHHCRACGQVFCYKCLSKKIDQDMVCNKCYDLHA